MRLSRPKFFSGTKLQDVVRYLAYDLKQVVLGMSEALQNLDLETNFKSFTWEGIIEANSQQSIPNRLRQPIGKMIVVMNVGPGVLGLASDLDNQTHAIVVKNDSSNDCKAKIIFMR